ncbi:electron transfer flavoprotein subunit alpha/FixB family protein [Acetobacter oeni]|uniref:Electron transfer flavoprotein subunit alpha n=1 Tax=Acetobacter oeni TaxID=304077 RepID=A0A511XM69_9PROT|nr:FAD-binding protein [Acetobacter oeni]MBB3884056.1 electron transfer flavoprotein alpha subunit [Acetobacter oeni]NHO20000.1 electron transfer flavoprotein subunit alpha/FixB family protein [Acetobacter oeni]GBR08505.1 electron transfer flavoprotein subunit alpha [Acetobacter oeni LMG 21952]GEN64042.1 electron transfer flavoprotein subunit beta [Acetobacter oeni]
MSVLLLAEVNQGRLATDAVAKTLSALSPLGEVHVLVASGDSEAAAQEASRLQGVSRVLMAQDVSLAHGLAEPLAALIVSLAPAYSHIAAPATAFSKNILPRVASLLDVMVLSDVTHVHDAETFDRPVYAGNAIQTVVSADPIKIFTVRTSSFSAVGEGGSAPIERTDAVADPELSFWVEDVSVVSERPDLTSARVVVSGGRGVGSKEKFDMIIDLADRMGAAVGASRAAVDLGYAPNDWQVGQTGKVVAPELYLAVGISGAIQHLAGMKDSKVIVAINKDEDAPVFRVADYALVGDLFSIVPELTKKLEKQFS